MKQALTVFVCLYLGFTSCSDEASESEAPFAAAAEAAPDPAELGTSMHGLQAAPPDPLTAASLPPDRPTGVNGKRPSRYGVETDNWQACISKTTATCTTGSGGLGATCGTSAPCNTDFVCVGGVCKRPGGLDEACLSNPDCASPYVCITGSCKPKSSQSGACDEVADCIDNLVPGQVVACVSGVCRTQGDIGAPCASQLDCRATSATGEPIICALPFGTSEGFCQLLSGIGGPCSDEQQCNQSTAPRCIPTRPDGPKNCQLSSGEGGFCDDKADCSQANAPNGRECVLNICRTAGTAGTPCVQNSNCTNGLVCIAGRCNTTSTTGGACDEMADCAQSPSQQACVANVCRVSGVLDGPCGPNNFCSNNSQCTFAGNPSGAMYCINSVCKCPSSDTCQDNSQCPPAFNGEQQVCVPRIAPAQGKFCRPVGTSPAGCCDEKADCRPIGASTCLLQPTQLGCNSGGVCTTGLSQGAMCSRTDECSGVLVCRINTNVPGRTYTTCEYPL